MCLLGIVKAYNEMEGDEEFAYFEEHVINYAYIVIALKEAAKLLKSCFWFIGEFGEHFKECFLSDILDAAECLSLNYLAYTLVLHIFH